MLSGKGENATLKYIKPLITEHEQYTLVYIKIDITKLILYFNCRTIIQSTPRYCTRETADRNYRQKLKTENAPLSNF